MLCHSTTAQCYLLFLIRTTVEVTFWKNPQAFLMSGENLGKRIMELVYRWEDFKESLSIVALPILHGNVIFWTSPWKFEFNTKCSGIILSYPLVDCFEFRTCLAGRCLCSQKINKYSNKPAEVYKRMIQRF